MIISYFKGFFEGFNETIKNENKPISYPPIQSNIKESVEEIKSIINSYYNNFKSLPTKIFTKTIFVYKINKDIIVKYDNNEQSYNLYNYNFDEFINYCIINKSYKSTQIDKNCFKLVNKNIKEEIEEISFKNIDERIHYIRKKVKNNILNIIKYPKVFIFTDIQRYKDTKSHPRIVMCKKDISLNDFLNGNYCLNEIDVFFETNENNTKKYLKKLEELKYHFEFNYDDNLGEYYIYNE